MIFNPLTHDSHVCRDPFGERFDREILDLCRREGLDPGLLTAEVEASAAARRQRGAGPFRQPAAVAAAWLRSLVSSLALRPAGRPRRM
jgi:hypothetical protein